MKKILVIEDDPTFAKMLEVFLGKHGYQVHTSTKGLDGIEKAEKTKPDLILLDYRLPDIDGIEVLSKVKKSVPQCEVILMTGFSDIRTAVQVMKMGAFDYITKPVNPDELKLLVEKAIKSERKDLAVAAKEKSPKQVRDDFFSDRDFVRGTSIQSKSLHRHIDLVAPTDMSVLILGESGTGKEYVARLIHTQSKRKNQPFIAVDCGALSEELAISELFGHVKGAFTGAHADKVGQFVAAKGGTLFLDEVGNLSYEVQVKLLRALQERVIQPLGTNKEINVDVRIITATNENLLEQVRDGKFREDLYHRINEFKIQVPSLFERKDDFWEFTNFFMKHANEDLNRHVEEFDDEVKEIFNTYSWPGNIRELRNTVRRAILLSKGSTIVTADTLPPEMKKESSNKVVQGTSPYDLKAQKQNSEREIIIKTLEEAKYNKSKAARLLNIDRKTLYLKISKYDIDA